VIINVELRKSGTSTGGLSVSSLPEFHIGMDYRLSGYLAVLAIFL